MYVCVFLFCFVFGFFFRHPDNTTDIYILKKTEVILGQCSVSLWVKNNLPVRARRRGEGRGARVAAAIRAGEQLCQVVRVQLVAS